MGAGDRPIRGKFVAGLAVLECPRCKFPLNQHYHKAPVYRADPGKMPVVEHRVMGFGACASCAHVEFFGYIENPEVRFEYAEKQPAGK